MVRSVQIASPLQSQKSSTQSRSQKVARFLDEREREREARQSSFLVGQFGFPRPEPVSSSVKVYWNARLTDLQAGLAWYLYSAGLAWSLVEGGPGVID